MAPTNKCLARSNKSTDVNNATKLRGKPSTGQPRRSIRNPAFSWSTTPRAKTASSASILLESIQGHEKDRHPWVDAALGPRRRAPDDPERRLPGDTMNKLLMTIAAMAALTTMAYAEKSVLKS